MIQAFDYVLGLTTASLSLEDLETKVLTRTRRFDGAAISINTRDCVGWPGIFHQLDSDINGLPDVAMKE